MRKVINFLWVIITIAALVCVGVYIYNREYRKTLITDIINTTTDKSKFKPYILGTNISFARNGNSAEYINVSDGWGGQEDVHRCALGNTSVLRLYIPDGAGTTLRLTVDAFGVFAPKIYDSQKITVYANDNMVTVWYVGYDGPFSVVIPDWIMIDNTLVLRFEAAAPYAPPPDKRKISMAVKNIVIEKIYGARIKREIGLWIKNNLMNGGIQQTYDTDIVTDDNWM